MLWRFVVGLSFPLWYWNLFFSPRVVVVRIWTQSLVKFELLEVPNECKKNRHFLCEYFFGCFQGNRSWKSPQFLTRVKQNWTNIEPARFTNRMRVIIIIMLLCDQIIANWEVILLDFLLVDEIPLKDGLESQLLSSTTRLKLSYCIAPSSIMCGVSLVPINKI